ncbi:MAG TPA: GNAT family N-acetyltransferase [Chitinophagaceae bacterium]|nr:GNAT family N-acetyltransferase [Chitinophagaceae bacterium]
MNPLLNNPVYNALLSGDAHLGCGNNKAKYFYEEVSPFAGFPEDDPHGFNELHNLLPANRRILFATRKALNDVPGWQLTHEIKGLQFVYTGTHIASGNSPELIPLESKHVEEMTALARLTKPGPFGKRTIDFGYYYGIFDNGKLVAMTGQRLHVENYTEISAVCTHPDHLGKGYAEALTRHQLNLICGSGKIPFLHVRDDNERAISLYLRLGFTENGPMNFYFLKRSE